MKNIQYYFFGYSPTRYQISLTFASAILCVLVLIFSNADKNFHWLTWLILVELSMDIGGGAISNLFESTKRFYQTDNIRGKIHKWLRNPLIFASLHIHLIIIHALIDPGKLDGAFYITGMIILAVVLASSIRHKNSLFFAGAMSLTIFLVSWFLPIIISLYWLYGVFIFKLVVAYSTRIQ